MLIKQNTLQNFIEVSPVLGNLQTKIFLIALCCSLSMTVVSQNLYLPRNVQKAFTNGTRAADGKPGKNYWQNRARYDIHVTLNPPSRTIKGVETITYFNNSPDTLKMLNIKLILNIHKAGAARAFPARQDYVSSGTEIDIFTINGTAIKRREGDFQGTNQGVGLPKPLAPHDSATLNIEWHFEMSVESGREGMIDPSTYFLAYFYPRVAVYDDYYGWDTIIFTDTFEFYNDFNDYTLKVSAPKNFAVWSTGTLQNIKEVLLPECAKRLQMSFTSDSVIHIATSADLAGKKVTAQNEMNTWSWKATDISDLTVAVSDHYVWDASSVIVDKSTKRRASMQAAFADTAKYFHRAVKDGRTSLSFLSNEWPGVPYPFPKMTTIQGFADMEYPMMVNDNDTDDPEFGQFVQDHEIAHTYFPFYMGINESRYGFMDEGWATTFELFMSTQEFGKEKAERNYKGFRVNGWSRGTSAENDLPVITPTTELNRGLGNNSYGKPSLSYLAIKDMLGDDLFRKCLLEFMNRWHGKHPIPWDYFNTFNNISGKNLNWFFKSWFFNNSYMDIAIDKVKDNSKSGKNSYELTISNPGGAPIPFDVVATLDDLTTETIHISPAVWESNEKTAVIILKVKKPVKSIKLETGIFVDADNNNNTWIPE